MVPYWQFESRGFLRKLRVMNMSFDYGKIKEHEGSKQGGFEELVCQIAHLSPPENSDNFVRKEGRGGDAGVECFWKLKDGSEHGWQAKYFLRSPNPNQWQQISNSVKIALEKHPKLTNYYICLPCDRTDSRKKFKGKKVSSSLNRWDNYVNKWKTLAKSKGMNVQFHYWGKHELNLKLSSEGFNGLTLFWFNEPLINFEKLRSIAESSKTSLGERYTQEAHQDLPIAKSFVGVGLDPEWYKELREHNEKLLKLKNKFNQKFLNNQSLSKINETIQKTSDLIDNIQKEFFQSLEQNKSLEKKDDFLDKIQKLEGFFKIISDYTWKIDIDRNQFNDYLVSKNKCEEVIEEFLGFLQGKTVQGVINKALMVTGKAGIGKSHLLCDFSLKRLNSSLPTLFVLGQHYTTDSIFDFLLERLDLKQFSKKQVLEALDAFGKKHQTRFLIVIDAINEGPQRSNWHNNIEDFLLELSHFENIGIILSCRGTYINYTIPKELKEQKLTCITHQGFRGFERRATAMYCQQYGISKPTAPILSPEFSNPLFVKICCKALKAQGKNSFPKGFRGITKLFDFYLENVIEVINRKKKSLNGENIVEKAIAKFTKALFPGHLYGLPPDHTRKVINECDSKPHTDEPLTDLLIDEGILFLDVIPDYLNNSEGTEVIRFTYERFSDYFVARDLIQRFVEDSKEDDKFKSIKTLIEDHKITKFLGICEALSVLIPEKYQFEFIDFIPETSSDYKSLFHYTFLETLTMRSPSSFSNRTLELFNKIKPSGYGYNNERIDILLSLSMEVDHPWNAYFLDENLRKRSLPERDYTWSIPISIRDQEEDEDQAESILRTIINWSLNASLDKADDKQLKLIAIVLLWVTTCTNRRVRDQATKALARVFSYISKYIPEFIEKYNNVNDPYLTERLYAAIYGAILIEEDQDVIKHIASTVYKFVFKDKRPYPNILLRDYTQGILEYAHYKNLLDKDIKLENFKPPYKSDWPIENPTIEEIEKLTENCPAIKRSVMMDDFGIYTMGCVHYWSPTPLTQERPETIEELQNKFVNTLSSDDLRNEYLEYISTNEKEKTISNEQLQKILEDDNYFENAFNKENLNKIIEKMSPDEKEHDRWLDGLRGRFQFNDPAFSRKWTMRWVCKKAYELGWSKELFETFERIHCRHLDRSTPRMERIGKKYQWIALYELLARMSDNLHWIRTFYDETRFLGPWQVHKRNIDPTFFSKQSQKEFEDFEYLNSHNWSHAPWLQKDPIFSFVQGDLDAQKKWLWNQELDIPIPDLIKTQYNKDGKNWLILNGYSSLQKDFKIDNEKGVLEQKVWFRISPIIVKCEDLETLKSNIIINKKEPQSSDLSIKEYLDFLREFPWRFDKDVEEWIKVDDSHCSSIINVAYLNPTITYAREPAGTDFSTNETYIDVCMPLKTLIKNLDLHFSSENQATWKSQNQEVIFIDPNVKSERSAHALIREDLLQKYLEKNDFVLVWLIGGEKRLIKKDNYSSYGSLSYSSFAYKEGENINYKTWFKRVSH